MRHTLQGGEEWMPQRTLPEQSSILRGTFVTGVILGIGVMGAFDEIVFHQLLQWHHFYTFATEYWRIVSDGVLHLFTTSMSVLGAVRLWSQRHHSSALSTNRPLWAGGLIGAGGFQLFDGIVNHKLLQLHPVREGVVNILPYDLAWNTFALILLAAGWFIWRSRQSKR
jgi:uncharacterized membrane protein